MQLQEKILMDEMYPDKPSKRQKVDSLIHSSIDIDQMILFELDLIEDSIIQMDGSNRAITLSLHRIKYYAEENSRKIREARNLVREIG